VLASVLAPSSLSIDREILIVCFFAGHHFQVFALTRVCERNCHAVGVTEAFAHRWDNSLCRGLLSFCPMILLSSSSFTRSRIPQSEDPSCQCPEPKGWRACDALPS
jgi:hypothetical protein